MCVGKSKIDSTLQNSLLYLEKFKHPIRLDVSSRSGGLLLYTRDTLSTRQINCSLKPDIMYCYGTKMQTRNWLVLYIYRNPKQDLKYFLDELTNLIDLYSGKFENLLILGDFNESCSNNILSTFMQTFSLKSLINNPTCFKSKNGKCIDLILTNKPSYFQNSNFFETGISDHHHVSYTMLKATHSKTPPKTISYRDFKNFSDQKFRNDLVIALTKTQTSDLNSFNAALESVLNNHVSIKKKVIRGNHKRHLTKALRKAIMLRSFYKNKYN